ncbi:MAG: tetratricopeptide repeat protein, partial [Chloroflexus sp.]|uniref:tetratricopeptide repeat protein n=1 Tax=Chloroflexus sp. TaxID=1904827 RepID=UPI004049D6D2
IGILCFVMVFILYFSMVSKVAPANQYNYLASTFNEEDRASSLCNLADQYIDNAMYHFQCSVALVQQLLSSAKANSAGMIMHQAITYQRKGLSFDPHWPIQRANLAVLNWLNGEKSLAVEQMKQVTRQAPYNSLLWLNYGWMAEQVVDQHEALEAYERALRSSPLLLDSDFKRLSSLFSLVSGRLGMWLVSEAQWDSWYAGEILDKDYLRGTIYLAIGEYERALSSFRDSADRFPPSPDYYVSLAYAWYKSGQISKAFQIAYDLALLHSNQLVLIKDPTLLSLVGLILQENGQPDLAYQCFLDAYLLQTRSDNRTYYSSVYRQPILLSDISPLLIHNVSILEETRQAWEWFVEESQYREEQLLARDIMHWYQNRDGMARMINSQ